jgi:hypothetical protein
MGGRRGRRGGEEGRGGIGDARVRRFDLAKPTLKWLSAWRGRCCTMAS